MFSNPSDPQFILCGGPTNKPVSLCCFVKAIQSVCYMKIREIYCWRIPISDGDIIDLVSTKHNLSMVPEPGVYSCIAGFRSP